MRSLRLIFLLFGLCSSAWGASQPEDLEKLCPFLRKADPVAHLIVNEFEHIAKASAPHDCQLKVTRRPQCAPGADVAIDLQFEISRFDNPAEKSAFSIRITPQGIADETPIVPAWTRANPIAFRLTCAACPTGVTCGCDKHTLQVVYGPHNSIRRVVVVDPKLARTLVCK